MVTKIGINGFGRIGRNFTRALMERRTDLKLVAFNDPTGDNATHSKLLKYDSVRGFLPNVIVPTDRGISVDGFEIGRFAETDPSQVLWGDYDVDIVIEATGIFTNRADAEKHMRDGVKRTVISAPADDADATICMGVNDDTYNSAKHFVVSNASCTTNCLAHLVNVLHTEFGFKNGTINTVHAYTSDQSLHDVARNTRSGKADIRRMRAAGKNIVPSSTGAAKTIRLVIPGMEGKIDGKASRVPVEDGSITELSANLLTTVTREEVIRAFRKHADINPYLSTTEDDLVSSDILGNPDSCIFSETDTLVVDGTLVQVWGWYDNEWAYSNRLIDLCLLMAEKGL